tara:strand:+ start:443 stop:805 length:363 start_codon:yes stop_codon:yes gene_type:complete
VLQPASGGTADGFGEGAGAGEEQGATDGSGTSEEENDPFLGGSPGHAGGGAKGAISGPDVPVDPTNIGYCVECLYNSHCGSNQNCVNYSCQTGSSTGSGSGSSNGSFDGDEPYEEHEIEK